MAIHIKKSKQGSLHKHLGVAKGKKIPASKLKIKSTDSPAIRKKKQFAINARKWHHAEGGFVLPMFGKGGSAFDSSQGTMLENNSSSIIADAIGNVGSLVKNVGSLVKNDYSKDLLNKFNKDPNVNNIYQDYMNRAKDSESLTDTVVSVNPLWSTFDSLGSGIANILSPDQRGEKSMLGSVATDVFDPSQTINTGGLGLWDAITGKKNFNWTDLWGFTLPILGGLEQEQDLRNASKNYVAVEKRRQTQAANAAWTGYAKRGGVVPFAQGGLSPYGTPINVEGGEVMRSPMDGSMVEFAGPSHANGGIDIAATPGSEIYGRLKVKSGRYKGWSYSDAASDLRKKIAALDKKLA